MEENNLEALLAAVAEHPSGSSSSERTPQRRDRGAEELSSCSESETAEESAAIEVALMAAAAPFSPEAAAKNAVQ